MEGTLSFARSPDGDTLAAIGQNSSCLRTYLAEPVTSTCRGRAGKIPTHSIRNEERATMIERTTTGFGNRVTYTGMDATDEKSRKAVESTHGRRVDWSQVYGNYAEAARHTAYASANKVPLFETARPAPVDRHLWIERLAAALAGGTPRDQLLDMIDEDVLRRTGVDIRGKSFTNGETFGARVPVSGYFSPELTLFVLKLMLKGARVVPITEHGEEPVPYGVSVVAPFADPALNALQVTEGLARLGRQFLTPGQRDRYTQMRNAAITQRNEAIPPELDPINEYASFVQHATSLRDLVHDSYPRPRQGEEVRDDFAARLEPDLAAFDHSPAWPGSAARERSATSGTTPGIGCSLRRSSRAASLWSASVTARPRSLR